LAGDDGILSLNWSSKEDRLVSTNWDGGVRIWDVQEEQVGGVVGQQQVVRAIPRAKVTHDKLPNGFNSPVFDSVFSEDGSTVFSVGGDKAVRMWPLGRALPPNNIATQIGVHEAPAKAVGFLPSCSNLVVSGGWDRKLKFWDTRSPNPAGVFEMPERIHSLDVRGNLMVVITAGRHVLTYNVGGPLPQEQSRIESPLAHQSRCVSCFPDQIGFAIGSIGGRVRFQYLREEKKAVESFSFRCHRQVPGHAYSVNAIAFHPNGRVFATAGSDGGVSFWDKGE
jgi:mRNA export factor